jgi:metal-responsive CopG/Arc/MetJ family transcriptional regulator
VTVKHVASKETLLDAEYNFGHTPGMKTAISIPDPLFQAAEQYAQAKGLSRSELYAKAIQHYLETFRYHGITEALNSVYSEEVSTLEPEYIAAQGQILSKEEW